MLLVGLPLIVVLSVSWILTGSLSGSLILVGVLSSLLIHLLGAMFIAGIQVSHWFGFHPQSIRLGKFALCSNQHKQIHPWFPIHLLHVLQLNAVSLVNLAMALGIAVEFCAHVLHAFGVASGQSKSRLMILFLCLKIFQSLATLHAW